MSERQQIDYNKLIAKDHDGDFIFLDYVFTHSDDFKGATGTRFEPISKDEYAERTSPENVKEYLRDIWQMQVSEGHTEDSLDEYVDEVTRFDSVEDIVFDTSYAYSDLWEQMRAKGYTEEEYPYFECTGGGRIFDAKNDYAEVYEPELLKLIEQYETKEATK